MTDESKLARLEEAVANLKDSVKTGFVDVKSELKEIKDGLVARVERLESTKLSASDFVTFKGDIEARLRKLERFFWGASAIIGLIQFIGVSILAYILKAIIK